MADNSALIPWRCLSCHIAWQWSQPDLCWWWRARELPESSSASSAESVGRWRWKLEHCLPWVDKMVFAETIIADRSKYLSVW